MWAIDIYYERPRNALIEAEITAACGRHGGSLDFVDESEIFGVCNYACMSFEFANLASAENAIKELSRPDRHLEGPYPYSEG